MIYVPDITTDEACKQALIDEPDRLCLEVAFVDNRPQATIITPGVSTSQDSAAIGQLRQVIASAARVTGRRLQSKRSTAPAASELLQHFLAGTRRFRRLLPRLHPDRDQLPARADWRDPGTPAGDACTTARDRARLQRRLYVLRDAPGGAGAVVPSRAACTSTCPTRCPTSTSAWACPLRAHHCWPS